EGPTVRGASFVLLGEPFKRKARHFRLDRGGDPVGVGRLVHNRL
ncbi:MAG: hypothetical protein AVDCRST_MAG55-1410, partial [uncultured Rubrobacteraceae bacterium]